MKNVKIFMGGGTEMYQSTIQRTGKEDAVK